MWLIFNKLLKLFKKYSKVYESTFNSYENIELNRIRRM